MIVIHGIDMRETRRLVELAEEVCNWLYTVRGMIAADYAKDLAKQITLAKKELQANDRPVQDNRTDTDLV